MAPSAYAMAALDREVARVATAAPGTRGTVLFRSAAALGQLVAGGELAHDVVEGLLFEAALATGLKQREVEQHVQRGLREGATQPRTSPPESHPREGRAVTAGTPRMEPPSAPVDPSAASSQGSAQRPPRHEVERLWNSCTRTAADAAVSEYLRSQRGLDPEIIDLWGIARAIPIGMKLPRWASCRGRSWSITGHRLVFRAFDATGEVMTIRSRCIVPIGERLKALSPAGFQVRGTVLACPLARQLLQGPPPSWWTPHVVLFVEGEPDHLTVVTQQGDAYEQGPAVFGVFAGSWSADIAARVPDGAVVVIRTHHDESGNAYARQIYETLKDRCAVRRSLPGDAA